VGGSSDAPYTYRVSWYTTVAPTAAAASIAASSRGGKRSYQST
jgi:hypothetical protein